MPDESVSAVVAGALVAVGVVQARLDGQEQLNKQRHEDQQKLEQQHHKENKETLGAILQQTLKTNGRVTEAESRITKLERSDNQKEGGLKVIHLLILAAIGTLSGLTSFILNHIIR